MNTKEISKGRQILILAALFLSTMCTMGDMVIVPIASNLYEVFDNVILVNAIISAPAVTGLLFCLIGGRMVDVMDKKLVMVLGFLIFTLSSVFGAAIENVYFVLICRLLATGVAWGLTSTAALGIIADMFLDEQQHGMIVGWYNAAMAAIGVVYTKLKNAAPLPSFFLIALGFFLMAFIPNKAVAVVSCAVMGASWGIFFSYFYAHCTEVVPEDMSGTALGIVGAVNGIASFFCTYMVTGFQSIFHINNSIGVWPIFGAMALAVAVLSCGGYMRKK